MTSTDTNPAAPPASSSSAVVVVADPAAPPANDPYDEFFEDFAPCVVTVAYNDDDNKATKYGTGFILLSEDNYTVIFASDRRLESRYDNIGKYYIYFDANVKIEAEVLECNEFLILLVRDEKERKPVRFCVDPVEHEEVTTIGAMGGIKLHVNTRAIHTLIGVLGSYIGDVTTKSCAARDSNGIALEGTERFFRVECFALNQIVTVRNVDNKSNQTARRLASAPVFRLTTGEVVGIIYSTSDWCDIKKGLHAKDVISVLLNLFQRTEPDITKWEDGLKRWAERRMQIRE
uniref:Uncharacterized protein n=4 Tax=Avena sativa TaxID=4498 RepID=A0ACD5ZY52_AVESA